MSLFILVSYNRQNNKRGAILNTYKQLPNSLKLVKYSIILIIGFFISILSGLLGIGGGSIMVPVMVYLIGIEQHKAHGTSLAVMSPVALFTAIYYANHGHMDWIVALELTIGGVVGAGFGANLCTKLSAQNLRKIFGIVLLLVGIKMLFDAFGSSTSVHETRMIFEPTLLIGIAAIILIGVLTGILSGLLGVGGGIVMVPAMVILLGISQKMAQGISLAVIIPVSISGAMMHAKNGNVDFSTGIWLAIGGILGALLGAHIAIGLNPNYLCRAFGILMIVMGAISYFNKPKN